MNLEVLINKDIKEAMLAKDSKKLEALRAIKASLLLLKTGKGMSDSEIPENVEMALLQKLIKQRKESAKIYASQNREDLAAEELFQASVIEKYLPEQMSGEELQKNIEEIIRQTGAASAKEMGRVMALASKQLAGKADNSRIAIMVKKLLDT